ncbi:MAG: T9SS type A sorting domain-containing protein [Ignavibacteriales bacterium]|nr:T9SS type A sorting domain-containing protein [Ignavibacteriales bacterium]
MKKLTVVMILLLSFAGLGYSVTHTITNVGTTFSPNSVTINLGDTVIFALSSLHNAVEVNQTTWNANGTTSNGGFALGFGGGSVVPLTTGTYYYVCTVHASLGMKGIITVNQTTDIKGSELSTPREFTLMQNFPNPFNPRTEIYFQLNHADHISIKIYNMLGTEIITLIDENVSAGEHRIEWDAAGQPSGIYFYQLKASGEIETRRMVLAK